MIITSTALQSSFQPLLDEKIARGLSGEIVTTGYIYATYTGTENGGNADKIRSFIRDYYTNHGTQWVLLGGDSEVVPARGVYASTSSETDNNLATDMYYACLDGPYNGNGNGIWGEWNDGAGGGGVDLVPDVYVGRAPASSATEAANFVAKTIQYETTPALNVKKAVLIGEKLDSFTYGSGSGIVIRDTTLPADWKAQVTELYDTPSYSFSASQVISALNASPNMVESLGHSSSGIDSRITTADVAGLANAFPYFMYSQGCQAGAFDTTDVAIGEEHVVGPHGAFAVVMNSRDGWYASGSAPTYSHEYAEAFFNAVFNKGMLHVGQANNQSKLDNLWRVGSGGTYRWIHFETNLLGDPETPFQLAPWPTVLSYTVTDDTGLPGDQITSDRTPALSFIFTAPVYGSASDVVVTDPAGNPVTPDSITGWATNTLTISFTTPLGLDGQYTVRLKSTIVDVHGTPLNNGVDEVRHFTIDTTAPVAGSVTPNLTTISDANVGMGTFAMSVTFNEAMNINTNPVISFTPGVASTLTYDAAQSWWVNNTTFVARFDVADANVYVPHVGIGVASAQDAAGNLQAPTAARTSSASTR